MANARRRRVYLTLQQMIGVMMSISHAAPVGIVTRTEPKMRKTGNPFHGRIIKVTEANVFANTDYQARVNRQRAREGNLETFTAGERAVDMVRRTVKGRPTAVLDMDKKDGSHGVYFEVHFYGHMKCETNYILDGRDPIAKAEFQEFLQERDSSSTAERQGTAAEQVVRTYLVRNVVELRHGGVDYVMVR